MPHVPEALTRGPFTLAEARSAGLDRWHLQGATWRRIARGVYIHAAIPDAPISRLFAARARLPDEAVFSGMTAAWLHGIDVPPCDPIEISVTGKPKMSTRAGVRVRRTSLADLEVTEVRGFRATTIARTIADVCAHESLTEAVVIVDAALHSRRLSIAQLAVYRSARGVRLAMEHAEPLSESPMESRLRMLLVLGGLPRPKAQVRIYDEAGRFVGRPDLYYEDARLGIEYDGAHHRSSLVEDDRRQNDLLRAGVVLLRFTGRDVLGGSSAVLTHVRTMRAARLKALPAA